MRDCQELNNPHATCVNITYTMLSSIYNEFQCLLGLNVFSACIHCLCQHLRLKDQTNIEVRNIVILSISSLLMTLRFIIIAFYMYAVLLMYILTLWLLTLFILVNMFVKYWDQDMHLRTAVGTCKQL